VSGKRKVNNGKAGKTDEMEERMERGKTES
jgi:hypothetical protein